MNSTLRRTRVRLLAGVSGAVALSVLAVAGCSSNSSSSTSAAAPASSSSAAPVPLVVYSAQDYDSAMTKAFTKATGIPVQLDDNSTGPLLTQIEASKNNPKWGLLWADGDEAFASLDTQGLLLKGWEPSVSFNSLGTSVEPKDESYVPTGVTLMGIVAYNKQKVKNPPTTYQALESSEWKGQVGMNDPSQSGPTYPLIAGVMNYLGSVSAGEKYFTTLKATGVVLLHSDSDAPHLTGQVADVAFRGPWSRRIYRFPEVDPSLKRNPWRSWRGDQWLTVRRGGAEGRCDS